MIRESYNVIKASVSASCKHWCSYYELNVWFEGDDVKNVGCIYNIDMYNLKEKALVKRGDGFKKVQAYLNTDEGKEWLGNMLKEQDLNAELSKIKEVIIYNMSKMDINELIEFEKMGENLIKKSA